MADAAAAATGGFFSGVWSRLGAAAVAAAAIWSGRLLFSRGAAAAAAAAAAAGDGDFEDEAEASVQFRIERRAAASRLVGRRLVGVSLNLEVLAFVYAFWRARRRDLSWRKKAAKALPVFVIPALAAIIYTVFVRFTRMLDLRDKKILERFHAEKQAKIRELKDGFYDMQKHIEKIDVGPSDNLATATSEHLNHSGSNVHAGDTSGMDSSWGYSNDFEPVRSDSLRHRKVLNGRNNIDSSSMFVEIIDELSDKPSADATEYIMPHQRIIERNGNLGNEFEEQPVAYSSAYEETNPSRSNLDCTECSPLVSFSTTNGGIAHEDKQERTLTVAPQLKEHEMAFSCNKNIFSLSSDSKSAPHGSNNLTNVACIPGLGPPTTSETLTAGSGEENTAAEMASSVSGNNISAYPLDCSNAHRQSDYLSSISSNPLVSISGVFEELSVEGDDKMALLDSSEDGTASCSGKETPRSASDCSESNNSTSIVGSSVPSTIYGGFPATDGEEGALTLSPQADNHEKASISIEDISTSSSHCNNDYGESNHSRPTIPNMVANLSTTDQGLPPEDGEVEARNASSSSGKETTPSPSDFGESNNSSSVTGSSEPSTICHEFPATENEEQAVTISPQQDNYEKDSIPIDGSLEHEKAASHSGKETPTSPTGSDNDHADSNNSTFAASNYLPITFQEFRVKDVEKNALAGLQQPVKYEISLGFGTHALTPPSDCNSDHQSSKCSSSPTFRELPEGDGEKRELGGPHQPEEHDMSPTLNMEVLTSPSNYNSIYGNSNESSSNSFSPIAIPSITFEELPAEVGMGEALTRSQQPKGKQMAASTSDEESPTSPSVGNGAQNNSNSLRFFTYSPEFYLPAFPELPEEGGKEEPLSGLLKLEKNDMASSLEKELSISPDEVSSAENCLEIPPSTQAANTMEALRDAKKRLSELQDERAFRFEDTFICADDANNAENYTNSGFAQCIPEANTIEALHGGNKVPLESLHENTFRLEGTFVSPDQGNNAENYLNNSRSFSCISEANVMEALGAVEKGLSELEDERVFSLEKETSISQDEVNNTENYTDNLNFAQCIPEANMREALHGGEEVSSESPHENNFSLEQTFISPDELTNAENYSNNSRSSSCIQQANVMEALGGVEEGFSKSEDKRAFSFGKETFISLDEVNNSENCADNSKLAQCIPEANTTKTHQGGKKVSSSLLHENTFTFEETFISSDVVNNAENYSYNSRSSLCTPEANVMESIWGCQEGSFEPQDEKTYGFKETSISLDKVGHAESYSNDSNPTQCISEANMMEDLQDHEKVLSELLHEKTFSSKETSISPDEVNNAESYSYNSRSSSCTLEANVMEALQSAQKGYPKSHVEKESSFQETSVSPNDVSNAGNYSDDSRLDSFAAEAKMMEALRGGEKGLSESLYEKSSNFEETLIFRDEINNSEKISKNSRSSCIFKANTMEVFPGGKKGLVELQEPEGHEIFHNPEETPDFVNEGSNAQSNSSNSNSASSLPEVNTVKTPQETLASGGNKKVALKDEKALEGLCTDDQQKRNELEDEINDSEHLVENDHVGPLEVAEVATPSTPKPSVKLYTRDDSWRDSAWGTSNDFEVAQVAGLRQRKPLYTRSNSIGSSTFSEPTDEQSTKLADDDGQTVSSPVASQDGKNSRNKLNDLNSTARTSINHSTSVPELPRRSI